MSNSVIVVTLNRPDCVRRCLRCLTEQTCAPDQVIVVDASQDDLTRDVVSKFPAVEYVRNDSGFGRMTASRNIALKHATGDVIAFLDDDAFAEPDWLERLLEAYEDPKVGAAGGRALNNQPGEEVTGVDKVGRLERNGLLHGYFAANPGRVIDVDHIMGCNMSFRREVLAELGGFREDYPGISGVREDSDMCLRVKRAGYRIVFAPGACVEHIGAPQAVGRRFDARYTYYASRNHVVMLIRNFGIGSGMFWRYLAKLTWETAKEFVRRVGAAFIRAGAASLGTLIGTCSGLWLLVRVGRNPARRDPDGVAIRNALAKESRIDRPVEQLV